jgi:hypothetical protein
MRRRADWDESEGRERGQGPVDRAAGALLGVGGCLSLGLFVLLSGASVVFAVMVLAGSGTEPTAVAQWARVLGVVLLAAVAVVNLLMLVTWWRALRGSLVALALLAVVGIALAAMTVRVYDEYESGLSRMEDWQFLLLFVAAGSAPALMSLGALLRLLVLLGRRRRHE